MFVRDDFLLLVFVLFCNNRNQDIHTIVITQHDVSVSRRLVAKLRFLVHSPVPSF